MAGKFSRHENVSFHFLASDEDTRLPGTVIVRPSEMVLSIPGGYGPYEIVGKALEHWYAGENSNDDCQNDDVEAKWCNLDGTFVGLWHENRAEFYFSFRLGPPTSSGDMD